MRLVLTFPRDFRGSLTCVGGGLVIWHRVQQIRAALSQQKSVTVPNVNIYNNLELTRSASKQLSA